MKAEQTWKPISADFAGICIEIGYVNDDEEVYVHAIDPVVLDVRIDNCHPIMLVAMQRRLAWMQNDMPSVHRPNHRNAGRIGGIRENSG